MTEIPSPPAAPPPLPPATPLPPPLPPPPLQRSSERAVVAGVCAGVARRWGVDPTLVRVLTVVLALFGGVGVVLYALGWLLLPEDTTGRSLGDRALRGGGPDGTATVLLALGLVLVVVVIGLGLLRDSWFPVAVLAVVALLAAAVLTRRPARPGPAVPPSPPAYPYGLVGPEAAGYVPTDDPAFPSGYRPAQAWEPAGYAPPAPTPPVAPPARPRSVLGLLTVSAAVLATGVLALVDVAGADVPAAAYLALPLLVVGLGLVLGAWRGRARGLIALGVVLALLLALVAVAERVASSDRWDESFTERTVAPVSAAGLDGRVVEQAAGDLTYDLSAVDFPSGSTDLTLRVGAGTLTVVVPDDVTVMLDAEVGAGELSAFGSSTGGVGLSRSQKDPGQPDAGTLNLDVEMGLGTVEVDRAGA